MAVIAVWALLSGSTEIVYDSASFTVEASGWEDLTVPYSEIAAVEYLPAEDVPETGMRTYGLGNLRVSFGYFFPTRPTAAISATPTIPAKTASG